MNRLPVAADVRRRIPESGHDLPPPYVGGYKVHGPNAGPFLCGIEGCP